MNELGHCPSYIYRGYKADINEGDHRIPFLARWPRRIAAGSSSRDVQGQHPEIVELLWALLEKYQATGHGRS